MLQPDDNSRPGTGTMSPGLGQLRARRPWAVGCRVKQEPRQ